MGFIEEDKGEIFPTDYSDDRCDWCGRIPIGGLKLGDGDRLWCSGTCKKKRLAFEAAKKGKVG